MPGVSHRIRAKAAPESTLIRLSFRRMTALPSRAAVPRKPLCRQRLGGAPVPPPSILLPIHSRLSCDSCANRHPSQPPRDDREQLPARRRIQRASNVRERNAEPRVHSVNRSSTRIDRRAASTPKRALVQVFPDTVARPPDGRSQIDGLELTGWPREFWQRSDQRLCATRTGPPSLTALGSRARASQTGRQQGQLIN